MKILPLMEAKQPEGTLVTTAKGDVLIVYNGNWYFRDELTAYQASLSEALSPKLIVRAPSNKRLNLIGQKFNKLTVLEYAYCDKFGKSYWLTECECGFKNVVRGTYLTTGRTKGCRSCMNKAK